MSEKNLQFSIGNLDRKKGNNCQFIENNCFCAEVYTENKTKYARMRITYTEKNLTL